MPLGTDWYPMIGVLESETIIGSRTIPGLIPGLGSYNYGTIPAGGLSESVQNSYINHLASVGTKVVRLWVNGQSDGSYQKGSTIAKTTPVFESSLRNYDDTVFDAIDSVLSESVDPSWTAYGSGYFYERRLNHVLSYKGKTLG
ncbi:hypothetical protein F4818DRAFT_445221 [Hypoxylon cercidicola]|nr:hypothetical protein F4818DRAFT_445221 [Hypoxylon cercidicola]